MTPMPILKVDTAEQGMKLIRFLARRLESADEAVLHRWIRTGQVRVNSGRAKPFARIKAGDAVRLPPFAALATDAAAPPAPAPCAGQYLGDGLRVLALTKDILALEKTGGLPTQPGSGHDDSVVDRLRKLFTGQAYVPAPAHRLDKDCSGVLLAGRTHEAQMRLHALFAAKTDQKSPEKGLEKIYLAWVAGAWPHEGPLVLRDNLSKIPHAARHGAERVRAVASGEGRAALAEATLCAALPQTGLGPASMLRIRLCTGRTHQIRAQLAERGYPIIGDAKYGGPAFPQLLLHAHRLAVPPDGEAFSGLTAVSWPTHWPQPYRAFTISPESGKG